MNFLKKSIVFAAVMAVFPAAFSAPATPTARPSIITNAASRMPTMTTRGITGTTTTTTPVGTATSLADQECIEAYTDCLKGADVCGPNFEECTNKTLFYAKRPMCTSTLLQCGASGINSLFGTSNQTAFANKNSAGEYTYPTDGSILGQLIEAAHINNRYDTSQCVRRYTDCLKKDDVCGSDFELCTSNTEFKKQKLFCESTLARCQDAGKKELYGSTNTANNPAADSRLGIMISEGAALAAVNSVATCYKVADQCMLAACSTNPYKCKEGSNREISSIVDTIIDTTNAIGETVTTTTTTTNYTANAVNKSDISGFIRKNCLDTIGGNKFCYATFLGNGAMPTNSQIRDEDNKADVYSEAYSARWNETMKSKIDELIERFDKKTKQRCQDTIVSCAMRSCGGGSGLACYNVAASGNKDNATVDVTRATNSIRSGCEAVIEGDNYCKYSTATFQSTTGMFNFLDTSIFDVLFTNPKDVTISNPDPVGAVAALNLRLANSFSPTAMTNMTRQCQNVAKSCVKSMCGDDYAGCYRNRTDVASSITKSGAAALDKSMNKTGGILDRTIIVGLCMEVVKNNTQCEELMKATAYSQSNSAVSDGGAKWGSASSVGEGWLGVGATGLASGYDTCSVDGGIVNKALPATMACGSQLSYTDADNNQKVATYNTNATAATNAEYAINLAADQIFQSAINELEMDAQAQYNSKLTKQQNMCLAGNNAGGIIGTKDTGSTFMWAKLTGNGKVPNSYAITGLTDMQFVPSNELYGSFCRIRVTLHSDDKAIQDAIAQGKKDWSTAYFAAGDTFTCGSWIPNSALEEISRKVGESAADESRRGDARNRGWLTALGSVAGAVGGGVGMNALQKTGLGGLLGTTNKTDNAEAYSKLCVQYANNAINAKTSTDAKAYATAAVETANKMDGIKENPVSVDSAITNLDDDADSKTIKAAATSSMTLLKSRCELAPKEAKDTSSRTTGNLIGVGAGAVIGGTLTWLGTKSVQDANADNAAAAAEKAWMDAVGNHIRCYIGADEVGMYSDIISTEMN